MIGLAAALGVLLLGGTPHGDLVDTTPYAAVLSAHVKDGRVDYAGLKGDREKLDAYVKAVGALPRAEFDKGSKGARIAYLVNAYNAFVLEAVVDGYPKPVKDKGGLFGGKGNSIKQIKGVFDKARHKTALGDLTLDQIEKDALLGEFGEPIVLVALCDGAAGAPPLRGEPYHSDKVLEELEDQARNFMLAPSGLVVSGDSIKVSPLFKANAKEFDKKYGKAFSFVEKYSADEQRPRVTLAISNGRTGYLDFDWTLNEQEKK